MALRAIDLASLDTPTRVAPRSAMITPIAPAPRMVALAAARRERRKWFVLGALLAGAPFFACIGVLEVVR
jgi:hypothetical protein